MNNGAQKGVELLTEQLRAVADFHDQKHPGDFWRNHVDFLLTTCGGRASRYLLSPYVAYKAWSEGLLHSAGIVVTATTLEIMFFIYFVAYFSPIKKTDLLGLMTSGEWGKLATRIGVGYTKGTLLKYPYLYKIFFVFLEQHPKACMSMIKTSVAIQRILGICL